MVDAINAFLSGIPQWLHVVVISMLPIIELRGALPFGVLVFKMPIIKAMLLSVIGNLIPAPFIIYLAKYIIDKMMESKNEKMVKFATYLRERGLKRSAQIEKYTFWGLVLFVGVPLPGTGAWTGSLIASLLQLDQKKSLLAVFLGVVMAGCIVSLLIKTGIMLF